MTLPGGFREEKYLQKLTLMASFSLAQALMSMRTLGKLKPLQNKRWMNSLV